MNKLTGYLPALAIVLLTTPFLLLLIGVRIGTFDGGMSLIPLQKFIFTDDLYAQAIGYLQAPIALVIVLRYHSPAAQNISGNNLVKWPNNTSTWILVGICIAALVITYLSRYIFAADNCVANTYCKNLSRDIDINTDDVPRGVTPALRAYASALIAGTIAILTAVFVGAPEKQP